MLKLFVTTHTMLIKQIIWLFKVLKVISYQTRITFEFLSEQATMDSSSLIFYKHPALLHNNLFHSWIEPCCLCAPLVPRGVMFISVSWCYFAITYCQFVYRSCVLVPPAPYFCRQSFRNVVFWSLFLSWCGFLCPPSLGTARNKSVSSKLAPPLGRARNGRRKGSDRRTCCGSVTCLTVRKLILRMTPASTFKSTESSL